MAVLPLQTGLREISGVILVRYPKEQGVPMSILRRDFLKYCAGSAAVLGLEFSPLGSLEKALAASREPSRVVPVTYQIPETYIASPYTTLAQTVVPDWTTMVTPYPAGLYPSSLYLYQSNGFGTWNLVGSGIPYQAPNMATGAVNSTTALPSDGTPLLTFFTMSDVHICDKESPGRCIGFSYNYPEIMTTANGVPCPVGNTSSYSGVILSTTHVLDAAVQTINALHQNATPFNFGIALGDAADNTQYNELRWYIDVLDGKPITPSSGLKGGTDIVYQTPYQPAGLDKSIKWYQAIGNHDQFWMGSTKVTNQIRKTLVGSDVLHLGVVDLPPSASAWAAAFSDSDPSSYYYMGVVDGATEYGEIVKTGLGTEFNDPPQVVADPNRRSLAIGEWMNEFFDTTSQPVGHGFTQQNVQEGSACYSFNPVSGIPIKVIVLDDTDKVNCGAAGALDPKRFNWLTKELKAGQNANELMIICAHIPVNPYLNVPMGDQGEDKYYTLWPNVNEDTTTSISQTTLLNTLQSYPNMVLWISGHVHRNTITPQPNGTSGFGFWEVETPSLRDFPQGVRRFQITLDSDGNISIFTDDVDTAPGSDSPASTSRTYAIGALQIFQNAWVVDGQTIPTALPSNTGSSVQQGPGMDPTTGVYNAQLVVQTAQLSQGLQKKLSALAPVVGTFQITSGNGSSVTLDNSVLGSTPVSYMASESPKFRGASPQPYSNAPSFTLSSGSGTKTVYFKVINAGQTESAVVHASIKV